MAIEPPAFYCTLCARRYGWPLTVMRSFGPCDACERPAACCISEGPPEDAGGRQATTVLAFRGQQGRPSRRNS